MGIQEGGQGGDDDFARDACRHVDAQPAAQRLRALAEHRLQLLHVGQQVLAALEEGLAVLRELDLARGPMQQARAEQRLQLLHRHGGGRLGNSQAFGRAREAGEFGHADEDLHRFQRVGHGGQGWGLLLD